MPRKVTYKPESVHQLNVTPYLSSVSEYILVIETWIGTEQTAFVSQDGFGWPCRTGINWPAPAQGGLSEPMATGPASLTGHLVSERPSQAPPPPPGCQRHRLVASWRCFYSHFPYSVTSVFVVIIVVVTSATIIIRGHLGGLIEIWRRRLKCPKLW